MTIKPQYREANGNIKWDLVDPWIRAVKIRGGMSLLAEVVGIHKLVLRARRRDLGLPTLPSGRIPERKFTAAEEAVRNLMNEGYSYNQMAAKLGVSKAVIQGRVTIVKKKEVLQARYCDKCKGLGLEECLGCSQMPNVGIAEKMRFSGPHFHVCSQCEGKSVYMPELT